LHRTAELNDRVTFLTAPVAGPGARFQVTQIKEETPEAEQSVRIEADKLQIHLVRVPDQKKEFAELEATGGTELEGHAFRAQADVLLFSQRLEQFTLRGLGKNARLYYQKRPGDPASSIECQMMQYVPRTGELILAGSRGLNGGL
jgi:hypothetical protein